MNKNDILAECRKAIFLTAPELCPVTLLEAADTDLPSVCATAWTLVDADFYVADHLKTRGQWDGKSPLIVFDLAEIEHEAACYEVSPKLLAVHIALHEAAHLVPWREVSDADLEPSQESIAEYKESFSEWAAGPACDNDCPWIGHDWRFIRNLLHLAHRANAAGYSLHIDDVRCGGITYRLSPAWQYAEALGDEPARFMYQPFSNIVAEEPPAAFLALFDRDVDFYRSLKGAKR